MNSFDKNLQFTIDEFVDKNVHFLDIKINKTETDVFHKPTNTGQYCHFSSQIPWRLKIAWIKSLYHRAAKICSNSSLLNQQIDKIKMFTSWNGFPTVVVKSILRRLQSTPRQREKESEDDDVIKIYMKVPYTGEKGEQLLKSCIKKLRRFTKKNVICIMLFQTKKLSMFCPTKDPIEKSQKANVIYKLQCPGCGGIYVGKTDRCISIRLHEHGTRNEEPMFQHLIDCHYFHDYVSLFKLPTFSGSDAEIDVKEHIKYAVLLNYSIIDFNSCWSQLSFLEAFYIKRLAPAINKSLKASKELQLFS